MDQSAQALAAAVERCPECGAEVPALAGFVSWCAACGWNLHPPERAEPATRLARLYERAGKRLGDRLAQELLERESLEPRASPARIAAYGLATLAYALTFALFAGGLTLTALTFFNPFMIVVAAIMVGAALLMRPRFGKRPERDVVDRKDAPELYALVDSIAAALGTQTVDTIVVDHAFNAAWSVAGLRHRVLTLGLPLLTILTPQQRVAVIAHELAHGRNGDAARGRFVGGAVGALVELYGLVAPHGGERELLETVAAGFFWVVSRPLWWLLLLETHLLLRDSQRAEYLADALAARTAGADAVIALHERMLLATTFYGVVQDAARDTDAAGLLDRALRRLEDVPEREHERRRRVARLEASRLDDTHPPTARRIELLERRGEQAALVSLNEERSHAIDEELRRRRPAVERTLVDEYRAALYY